MTVRCFGGIAGSPSERTLSIRRSWSQSQAVHRLPLEGLRVPDGNPQHVLAQRQCDLANGEHETGVACGGQRALYQAKASGRPNGGDP